MPTSDSSSHPSSEKTFTSNEFGWRFDNSFVRLPEQFYSRCNPVPVRKPQLILFNRTLAHSLGLSFQDSAEEALALTFSGNFLPKGSEPIAQAYAGHQYGGFTMLGDGRAILVGEHVTKQNDRVDIQLKGAGQTPYSRRGDGRAAMGPMLREYIISEAMHALGIPSTRSLAVVSTGEVVYRERPLQGAILTRVAASHIRVGTFEFAAARNDLEGLRALSNYTIHRHFPEIGDAVKPFESLLQVVMERQAALVAKWMHVGFVHGVMNTDNMAISGETIDYGPCAFMDRFDPATVFSSIDSRGRYAYGNQPSICHWNLTRFAESLLPLIHPDEQEAIGIATDILSRFPDLFQGYWLSGMRLKLGLLTEEETDLTLIQSLLNWMSQSHADFTNTFRNLSNQLGADLGPIGDQAYSHWFSTWRERLSRNQEPIEVSIALMQQNNPVVIPRNQRVEEALEAATVQNDLSLVTKLLSVLESPFSGTLDNVSYREPPATDCENYQTFCGT